MKNISKNILHVLSIGLMSVTLVGCGQPLEHTGTTAAPYSNQPNTTPIDVCGLFQPQEIERILGKGFQGTNDSTIGDFDCEYETTGHGNTVSITVHRLTGPSDAQTWYQIAEANKDASKIQPIAGIGDRAEFVPDSLVDNFVAHKGLISVTIANSTLEDDAFLTAAKTLAQDVLERAK